jgi:mRNA-degrading endonuclease YafQ of YafQ-DinJ toxin-antitoxin module
MRPQIRIEHLSGSLKIPSETQFRKDLAGIDQRSDKVRRALEELSAAYDYASRSVDHALQTAKSLQEMRSLERKELDLRVDEKSSFQEYTHSVEQILERLANKLIVVVRQNKIEDFLSRGLYPIQTALNNLVKGRKEGN